MYYKIDPQVEIVEALLVAEQLLPSGKEVYYGRQLEVALEDKHFHWITKRALNALANSGTVSTCVERLKEGFDAHFYWPRAHRYARRQMKGLIDEISDPLFTRALGHTGEQLFDVAMARLGFRVSQSMASR